MTDQPEMPEIGDVYSLESPGCFRYRVEGVQRLGRRVYPLLRPVLGDTEGSLIAYMSHMGMRNLGYVLEKKNCEHSQFWKS